MSCEVRTLHDKIGVDGRSLTRPLRLLPGLGTQWVQEHARLVPRHLRQPSWQRIRCAHDQVRTPAPPLQLPFRRCSRLTLESAIVQ